jgi:nicotinate-nucleotide adenylyltransferase
MARAAIEGDAMFDVSDVEIARAGPSYTYDTVREMYDRIGGDPKLHWLIGADQLSDLHRWHRARELVELVTFVTAVRPGWRSPSENELAAQFGLEAARRILSHCYRTPFVELSASEIRARLSMDRSIRHMVPDAVAVLIDQHRLYRNAG